MSRSTKILPEFDLRAGPWQPGDLAPPRFVPSPGLRSTMVAKSIRTLYDDPAKGDEGQERHAICSRKCNVDIREHHPNRRRQHRKRKLSTSSEPVSCDCR